MLATMTKPNSVRRSVPVHVNHPEISTNAAVTEAVQVCAWINSGARCKEHKPEPKVFFKVLQTCALHKSSHNVWASRYESVYNFLMEEHAGILRFVRFRHEYKKLDEDVAISESSLALARAIRTYDWRKGFQFSTWAYTIIHRALGRKLVDVQRRRRMFPITTDPRYEDGTIPDKSVMFDRHKEIAIERLKQILETNAVGLSEEECLILNKRFPMDSSFKHETLELVGERIGLSKERVRQIQMAALAKLRAALESDPVLKLTED